MLDIQNLSIAYGDRQIIKDLSFSLKEHDWFMLLGPNGVGKSTIFKAFSHALNYGGEIFLLGQNIKDFSSKERAKSLGFLNQHHAVTYPYRVEEVVELGRYPYLHGPFSELSNRDREKIEEALERTGLQDKREQSILTLSGGELQRTFLAQVIAQDPQILILDEPANHLDLAFEYQFYDQIDHWRKEKGRAVFSIMHDLTVAKAFGNKGLLLSTDGEAWQGSLDEILTRDRLKRVYGIDLIQIFQDKYKQWAKK